MGRYLCVMYSRGLLDVQALSSVEAATHLLSRVPIFEVQKDLCQLFTLAGFDARKRARDRAARKVQALQSSSSAYQNVDQDETYAYARSQPQQQQGFKMGSQPQAPQHAQPRTMLQQNSGAQNGGPIVPSGEGTSGSVLARFGSLPRQASIYSLTLDELQSLDHGKNFGSMNMNEFLKNIWTVEESQAMASVMTGVGSGSNLSGESPTEGSGRQVTGPNGTGLSRQTSLTRQSSLTLPRTLSRKTVEEVWRDIHRQPNEGPNGAAGSNGTGPAPTSSTFGEMTLEDFLVKAGVVREDAPEPFGVYGNYSAPSGNNDRDGSAPSVPTLSLATATLTSGGAMDSMAMESYKPPTAQAQAEWYKTMAATAQQQQQQYAHHQQQMQAAHAVDQYGNHRQRVANGGGMVVSSMANGYAGMAPGMQQLVPQGMMGVGVLGLQLAPTSPTSPMSDGVGHSHGNGLSLSPAGNYGVDGAMRGRRKGGDGPQEKTVERRQRRMIKNRESAARSRARKQAYTVELEAEVTLLKEENSKLKRQQIAWKLEEITESRKKQMMTHHAVQKVPRSEGTTLRRTRTGPW